MAKTETDEVAKGKTKKDCCGCFRRRKEKVMENESKTEQTIITRQPSKVPFSGVLPNNLTVGNVICISGFVQPNCIRFAVNLSCGKGPNADIAFHLNPRLDRNYVVRNARLQGCWGDEETSSIVKFNIARNRKFEIAIFIAKQEFMVSLNGTHFCAFNFRVPLNLCTGIEIEGNLDVHGVEYKTWTTYPENIATIVSNIPSANVDPPSQHLAIPFTGNLARGFEEGWKLEISGRVKLLPHSFYINLQNGAQLWPHPIIPLHLNPRFMENVLVGNAWTDGRWGAEERTPGFPFSPGSNFRVGIRRETGQFSVWVDGKLCAEFKFRGAFDKIDTIYIQGDLVLKEIVVEEAPADVFKNGK